MLLYLFADTSAPFKVNGAAHVASAGVPQCSGRAQATAVLDEQAQEAGVRQEASGVRLVEGHFLGRKDLLGEAWGASEVSYFILARLHRSFTMV